jgi:1,4-dihydroxy-2-naphthoyl-CoA synthase
MEKSTYEDVR